MSKLQKPGEKPDRPGEYEEIGPKGGKVKDPRLVTLDYGDNKLPPTQAPEHKWKYKGPQKP